MSNREEKISSKNTCKQMYIDLEMGVSECAKVAGVCDKTVYRWIRDENWEAEKHELTTIEKQININLRKALNKGLKAYSVDPTNKDLQSLVSLLKQFREQSKPSIAYKDNIMKFLDRAVDFFLEKGDEVMAGEFKKIVVELAEYLIKRN